MSIKAASVKTIGIFSPSSAIVRERFDAGVKILEQNGFDLVIHPQTYDGADTGNQIAGSIEDKLKAFKELQSNLNIDLIMASTGGNRACFMLDHLSDKELGPKPLMGFSDTTALLGAAYTAGISGIFGPTVQTLGRMPASNLETTLTRLKNSEHPIRAEWTDAELISIGQGPIEAPVFAATLAVLLALAPTRHMPDLNGHILILEDIGEELNNIDRMLWSLSKKIDFSRLAGLVFGQFMDLKDTGRPYGETLVGILRKHTGRLGIPVLANAPIGHDGRIYPFRLGQKATLDAPKRVLIF